MKKLIITLVLVVSGVILANAQCTPGTETQGGIYPDSAVNLPTCYATTPGTPYATVITAVIPADTIIGGFSIPIDSIGVDSIEGLPNLFNWVTNSSSNYWHGGTKGCCLISGTATASQVGIYHLRVSVTAHASGLADPYKITYFRINIISGTYGINEINAQNAISLNAYSDASNNSIVVKINSSSPVKDASIFVNDITGRELMRLENVNGNEIIMNRGSLSSGIYIVSLRNNEKVIAREKIFVE